jgi:hypothetical protein
MGMVKFGPNRIKMEERILEGVKECIKDINTDLQNDPVVDVFRIMIHTFGNIINEFVFGIKYDRDDGVWNYLQYLQEEGVKYIGICGAVNFLPILRLIFITSKISQSIIISKFQVPPEKQKNNQFPAIGEKKNAFNLRQNH